MLVQQGWYGQNARIRLSKKTASRERIQFFDYLFLGLTSLVNPDPVGSETFSRIQIQNNHSWSGSEQLRIQNEFEVKLLWKTGKIWQFLNKNDQLQNINSFLSKKIFPKKLISRHNNTVTKQEPKGKIYVKNN